MDKVSSFHFSNSVNSESVRYRTPRQSPTKFTYGPVCFIVLFLFFPRFYLLIIFLIYLFFLSFCLSNGGNVSVN